uniref:Calpain catalytic domain-containing protein n=1 Tax=Heterorhabditis bacteriophora TaxID=37862 RepID=A0A1I7WBP7_HETBA
MFKEEVCGDALWRRYWGGIEEGADRQNATNHAIEQANNTGQIISCVGILRTLEESKMFALQGIPMHRLSFGGLMFYCLTGKMVNSISVKNPSIDLF